MTKVSDDSKTKACDTRWGRRGRRPGAWGVALVVMALAPLEIGAKGCDSGIVGNECPRGTKSAKCGGGSGSDGGAAIHACGGLAGLKCDSGEYCAFPIDAQCGAADQTGVCTAIPTACDDIYKPVCGCDGKTYGNECAAAAAGTSVASEGECSPPGGGGGGACGSPGLPACAAGEFCSFPPGAHCGAADQPGACTTRPDICADIYKPVCGCDGKTYGNACSAAAAGVSVASDGQCAPPSGGKPCGGLTPTPMPCDKGQYCSFPIEASCGAADHPGVCAPIPSGCIEIYSPVCGCDGKTYGNDCVAASAGVSVASNGECAPTTGGGTVCGGFAGAQCAKSQYCSFPPDAMCGRADGTGVCATIPIACTKEYKPVCGCDGNTYGNACTAASAGVSVDYDGQCKPSGGGGTVCGGLLGAQCAKSQYCSFPPEAQCGAADQTGICTLQPQVCDAIYQPVCGCDGMSYSNACVAASAAVSVQAQGPCKKP